MAQRAALVNPEDDWTESDLQEWDAFHSQYDDDPNPYDGNYSED